MQIGSVIALYFVIWWVTLFAVLPFGIVRARDAASAPSGSDPGAPATVRFARIAIVNSIVAAVVLAIFWVVYVENWFDLAVIDEITRR
jgi:predicted secreted protein